MAKYFGYAMLECESNSKIKELKYGPVSAVTEVQDERQLRKDGTCIPPPPPTPPHLRSILMNYLAHPSSYPVGNEALFRAKSGQDMKLTTYFHVVQSAKVINEFKHTTPSILIHGVIT
jgi:hypothetical protein